MTVAIVRRTIPAAAHALAAAGMPAVLARIYAARGITALSELDHGFAALPSPDRMKGIDAAAERLARAIRAREKIVIVADYDADGATACAVGLRGLRAMGADVDFIVPNRFEFGYGLTPEIVALAAQMQPRLLVTVDNGIASVDGVAAAAAPRDRRADHRPSPARRHVAGAGDHRESEPARMHVPEQAHRRRRRDVLRAVRDARAAAVATARSPARTSPISPTCSTWSRSAPWPTWCGSTR